MFEETVKPFSAYCSFEQDAQNDDGTVPETLVKLRSRYARDGMAAKPVGKEPFNAELPVSENRLIKLVPDARQK